jgi:hypothetical protein
MGDPSKMVLLEEVIKVMNENKLVDAAQHTGQYLLNGLKELQVWNAHTILAFPSSIYPLCNMHTSTVLIQTIPLCTPLCCVC